MNRTEALERWRRIAAGDLKREQSDPVDLHAWIREVAAAILERDAMPNGRPGELVRAIGLHGHRDGYAELRAMLAEPVWEFQMIDADGVGTDQPQNEKVRTAVLEARARGLLIGIYADDDKAASDLIRNLLQGRL